MRATVMGPLKTSSQVRAWPCRRALGLSCASSIHLPTLGSGCLTASWLLFLSFSFPRSSLLTLLSAQDSALHSPHWQADIQAPL